MISETINYSEEKINYITNVIVKLKTIDQLQVNERRVLINLADLLLGTGKSPKKGEKIHNQLNRIIVHTNLVSDTLSGETLESLERRFTTVSSIKQWLLGTNIKTKGRLTRSEMLKRIIDYRDNFFNLLSNRYDQKAKYLELKRKVKECDVVSLDLIDIETKSIFSIGDVAVSKFLQLDFVPRLNERKDYPVFDQISEMILAIYNREISLMEHLSDEHLFRINYAVKSSEQYVVDPFCNPRELLNIEHNLKEILFDFFEDKSWFYNLAVMEYEKRNLPCLEGVKDKKQGAFKYLDETRFVYLAPLGPHDYRIYDKQLGNQVGSNILTSKAMFEELSRLNIAYQQLSYDLLLKELVSGATLSELANQQSLMVPKCSYRSMRPLNLGGLEGFPLQLVLETGSVYCKPVLKPYHHKFIGDLTDQINHITDLEWDILASLKCLVFTAKDYNDKDVLLVVNKDTNLVLSCDGVKQLLAKVKVTA